MLSLIGLFVGVHLCYQNTHTMKALIEQLFFDKQLVEAIKSSNTDREILYLQLISGKITMKEYMAAC